MADSALKAAEGLVEKAAENPQTEETIAKDVLTAESGGGLNLSEVKDALNTIEGESGSAPPSSTEEAPAKTEEKEAPPEKSSSEEKPPSEDPAPTEDASPAEESSD